MTATLVDLFERQVDRTPEADAVRENGSAVTYRELDVLANRIAHALSRAGFGRGDIVAVWGHPSASLYAALIGVMKAGCAYLPINPADPPERRRVQLADSGCSAIVGGTEQPDVPADIRFRLLIEALPTADDDAHRPRVPLEPCDLAYIMYTSGSSGRPKGVMVEHRSVVNLLAWARDQFELGVGSRVSQQYPVAFDASLQEVFGALVSGATLFPVGVATKMRPSRMVTWLMENAVTHLDVVPSYWRELIRFAEAAGGVELPALRMLILGGEALPGDLVRRWRRTVRGEHRIFNLYGPTEATVTATCFEVPQSFTGENVPLGRAIRGVEVVVLSNDRPCALGQVGEICISGAGLARGYVGSPDGFGSIYRTGDMGVRLLDDEGAVVFLGRRDHQVSVRGYRVELAEIEVALASCDHVSHAVALQTEEQLVAFYVDDGVVPALSEVRRRLRELLPEQMVPRRLVHLPKLPLTSAGKVDRQRLAHDCLDRPS